MFVFLVASDVHHLLMCLFAILIELKYLFMSFACFLIGLFAFFVGF